MNIPISEQPPAAQQAQMKEGGAGEARGRNLAMYEACPWVGTQRDPVPYYAFPARNNYCYRVKPAASIKLEHQETFCLSSNYVRCPIYRQKGTVALPDRWAKWKRVRLGRPFASIAQWRPSRQAVARFVLFLLFVAAAMLLAAGWYYQGGIAAWLPAELVAATATAGSAVGVTEVTITPSPTFTDTPTVTPSATATTTPAATMTKRPSATATATPSPTVTEPAAQETAAATEASTPVSGCVPPAGWVEYVVRPGDSLFRLGQRYGATIGALQQGNCMGNVRVIYVGQRLFVPGGEGSEE